MGWKISRKFLSPVSWAGRQGYPGQWRPKWSAISVSRNAKWRACSHRDKEDLSLWPAFKRTAPMPGPTHSSQRKARKKEGGCLAKNRSNLLSFHDLLLIHSHFSYRIQHPDLLLCTLHLIALPHLSLFLSQKQRQELSCILFLGVWMFYVGVLITAGHSTTTALSLLNKNPFLLLL